METATENQGLLVPEFESSRQDDIIDVNRDDEFDFEIGGDEDLATNEVVDDLNDNPANETDGTELHATNAYYDETYAYEAQEQAVQVSAVDSHDEEMNEQAQEELDLEVAAFETVVETVDFTAAPQDDGQGAQEYQDQAENEEQVEDRSHEELEYEDTAGEFEALENADQPEIDDGHGLLNATTSVDYIPEDGDHQDVTDEVETDRHGAEFETEVVQEGEYIEKDDEDIDAEPLREKEDSDEVEDTNVATDAPNSFSGGNYADQSPAPDELPTELIDESLDHPNWSTEDLGDQKSNPRPNVTISYQDQDYFLFAEDSDEDPDTYFLDEADSIHRPLSQFLKDVREVISSEVEADHEIFMKIDGLGLEFGESTTNNFLDQTTFAQIIEVNNKLVQHDGGSKSPELYIYLSVRSNPLHRFTELAKGADEGQGLSKFEKYYDEASANVSATNGEGLDDFTQDDISDDLSFDEAYEEIKMVTGGEGGSDDAQQQRNPFQVNDNHDESIVDTAISEALETETSAPDVLAVNETEVDVLDEDATGSAVFASGEKHDGLDFDATDVQETFDNTLGDGTSVSGQVDKEPVESWADGQDAGGFEELEGQTEVPPGLPQEGHERTDGERTFSLRRVDCVGPGPCLCDKCYELGALGFEGGGNGSSTTGQDPTTLSSSGYVPISEAEWDLLMTNFQTGNKEANKKAKVTTTNAADDADYLDLGEDGNYEETTYNAEATNEVAGGYLDVPRQLSDSSSASATLDGEDNGLGSDAGVTQDFTDPSQAPNPTENDIQQPEVDEIDWNHDEDDIGGATENPTNLSPSSSSAKRGRQDDEGANGVGDESGMFWAHHPLKAHANILPAVKRRRTEDTNVNRPA